MTRADFLSALRANPYDQALRLQYADWLMENGHDADATLVKYFNGGSVLRAEALAAHAIILDRERSATGGYINFSLRGGLICAATCHGHSWMDYGDDLLNFHPIHTAYIICRPTPFSLLRRWPGQDISDWTRLFAFEWPEVQFVTTGFS